MAGKLPKWLIATAAAVYFFLHAPLMVLVLFSFNNSKFSAGWEGFTVQWYQRLLERRDILDSLWVSVEVGVVSTIVSTLLGTLLALGLARHRFSGRTFLESLLYVPIVTPEIVCGISLLIFFTAASKWAGSGNELLAAAGLPALLPVLAPGLLTIIIAHVAFNISFVVVVVRSRLEGMDRNLEEAAMILGADEFTAFWKVTVPQLWPGILSGALLAFTMSFDDFVITSLVTGPGSSTLPIVVYTMVRKNVEPSINAISTIILVVTAVLIYASDRLSQDKPLAPT